LLTAGTVAYQYNVDGFLGTRTDGANVTTYDYSSRGELYSVTLPDGTFIEYVHDPLGRRIAKKVNGATTEKYLWNGMTRLLAVYDGSDTLKMRFEYADSRTPYAMTKAGVTYYLAYDQIGSLRIIADASGNVVKRIDYDAFGNVIADSAPAFEVPFGFACGLHDRDTGLIRFGFRDYDPDTGRWTAKDPIGFAGGDTDLYGYCLNNPINLTDPNGLAWRQIRPLNRPGLRNTTTGPFHHDRFLYDDGSDSGYYDDSTVRPDDATNLSGKYENVGEYLNDDILRQAEQNVKWIWDRNMNPDAKEYDLATHNCQDYADAVMREYYRLLEEKNRKNNSCREIW
jgi:RHS repeat-associated protein